MSDNIFEGLDEYLPMDDNIFKDKKPLDHRFLPDNLPHRKEQITAIARYWVDQTLLFMERQEPEKQQLQSLQESN